MTPITRFNRWMQPLGSIRFDSVPKVRELTNDFANSRYRSCLKYLADLKGDLQLDLHLHRHLDTLYKMVEDKCLMQ